MKVEGSRFRIWDGIRYCLLSTLSLQAWAPRVNIILCTLITRKSRKRPVTLLWGPPATVSLLRRQLHLIIWWLCSFTLKKAGLPAWSFLIISTDGVRHAEQTHYF